ncbi:hypothetical protein BH09MYX1_BH09MYX1_19910 [soil metagenome]
MKLQASRRLFALGTAAAVLGFSFSVGAQPAPPPSASAASAAPSASAASSSVAPLDSAATAPTVSARKSPPPPPPKPAQVAALDAAQKEADAYELGAKDYRDTVTTIIKLHYEDKKRSILTGLDHEIGIEKDELKKARQIAIQRLEEFIAKYSGPNSQPEATPDAMFRLAALYEEVARGEDTTEDLSIGLRPAIALYKRVIRDFPTYKELAGIYYYLGHAYNDSSRIEEAQQVWRSLVCHNHYAYPTPADPKNADVDTIIAMPQDAPPEFWKAWRMRYNDPKKVHKGPPDTTYNDVYPTDCSSIAQPSLRAGEDPKYLAEIWWQIGNWEFDQLDDRGGVVDDEPIAVWDLNRAASAYTKSLNWKKPPLYGVALYKYSWTLFKQQRYEAATREFVKLLLHTDELERTQGDTNVGDFRSEAYTYIAGSLTNIDFNGPDPDEPFIQRPDIVDTEPKPDVAEKKLHIAIDRVKDQQLIPQDKTWTIEIYKALAGEFRSLNQFNNAIEIYELILKKWPMDPTAPDVQFAIAETYDQMNVTKKQGTPEHDAIASKALEARTALANYIGNTPWVDANKENPAAIQNAERLVKGGLRQAAAAHTNLGKQLLVAATQTGNPKEQLDYLNRAAAEYRLATVGWQGYLKQDENAPDAYESRFWLADARNKQVRIEFILHSMSRTNPEPSSKEVEDAKLAAIDVRDSNEDDKYLDVAAQFVVEESDVLRDLDYMRFDDTKGTQGYAKRGAVELEGPQDDQHVKVVPIPASVKASMVARDEYISHVPTEKDPVNDKGVKTSLVYAFDTADVYFVYGDFANAKARFEPIYKDQCGKNELGFKAWEKLISIAAKSKDAEGSRKLAEAEQSHSCAVTADQTSSGKNTLGPIFTEASFVDADKKFKEACGRDLKTATDKCDPVTSSNVKTWKEAADLYNAALEKAPDYRSAPTAAMRAAFCYKQIGDINRAIAAYDRFIGAYGKEELLRGLEKGDPKAGKAADPKQYKERVDALTLAYEEEGTTYYGFFNYTKAAETYEKLATNVRFENAKRKEAAKNAMILYNAIGQREKMLAMYKIVVALGPTADEKANYDYIVASYDYQQWNPEGADTGSNQSSRKSSILALQGFYAANKGNGAAAKYVLEAAYRVAHMKKVASDPSARDWFKNTVAAWDAYKARNAEDAKKLPFADYGAEADFTLIDEEIAQKFDPLPSGYVKLHASDIVGNSDPKLGAVTKGRLVQDAAIADDYDKKLNDMANKYGSPTWQPAFIARAGTLYDGLRTGLYNCGGSAFKLFTSAQEAKLAQLRSSGRDDLVDLADNIEGAVKKGWRDRRDQEIDNSDTIMVRDYARAVHLGRTYNVRNALIARALNRLAYFTTLIGDDKLGTKVRATKDPTDASGSRTLSYTPFMYVQMRPGLPSALPQNGAGAPLPLSP